MGVNYRNVYYQDATPTPEHVGDLWITDGGVTKICYRTTLNGGANLWGSPTEYDITQQALTSGRVFVGNGSNLAAAVAITGDVALSNAGVTTTLVMSKTVINKTGSDILTDQLVALVGLDPTSGAPQIVLADADVAAHDDVWVTTGTIANNATGTVKKQALSAANLNTNAVTSAGDPVYLSTTAGGFTVTAPTTAVSRVHPVGFVVVKSATIGQILWHVGPLRKVGTNELQASAFTSSQAANTANGNVLGGLGLLYRITATNLTGDVDVVVTDKIRVMDVWAVGTAAGGAGDTITVKNGATAITDAIDMNVADKTVKRAGTIDDAQYEIAAAGTLRVTGASAVNAEVNVLALRVA